MADYGKLAHGEVVGMSIPEERVGDFSVEYIKLFVFFCIPWAQIINTTMISCPQPTEKNITIADAAVDDGRIQITTCPDRM